MQATGLEWWPSSHVMTAPNPFCIVWCAQHLLPHCHTIIFYATKTKWGTMHSGAEYGGAKLGRLQCLCLHVAIGTAEQKRMCWCFTRRVIPILFHISSREQTAPRNINPVLSWPQKAGAKWGQEVNPGLALNRRAVIVGSSESVKRPGSVGVGVGPRKGQGGSVVIWATRRRWGGEGGPPAYQLRFLLTEAAPHWHQSKLMTVLLLCSVVRSEMNRLCIQANKEPWHAYRSRKWEF